MNGHYDLRKSVDFAMSGIWEVAHYWADGITVQVKYFYTKKQAADYIKART